MAFEGSKRKVEWAEKHIGDLQACVRAFNASDYYRLRVDKDGKTGNDRLKFEIAKSVPRDIPLIIGDAIHNLRSALDFLTSDVVFLATGERSTYTKFPIHDTREKLVAALEGGTVKKASTDISSHILNIVKPYKGGNDAIWALNRLDIEDKHRLLIAYIDVTALHGVDIEGKGHRPFRVIGTMALADGATKMWPFITDEIKIHNYGQATFDVFFR